MNKHSCAGFLLLEFLVYMALTASILLCSAYWVTGIYARTLTVLRQGSKHTAVYAATDLLIRDLRQAPADSRYWKKVSENQYVWTQDAVDVGWSINKGTLIRTQGAYNAAADTWHDAHKSIIASNIESLHIAVSANTRLCACAQVTLTPKTDTPVVLSVALHEGTAA